MSNELNNIISRWTNGVYEGVAIGGDRYPGTTFMDHIMRYQRDPSVSVYRRQLRWAFGPVSCSWGGVAFDDPPVFYSVTELGSTSMTERVGDIENYNRLNL